MATVDEMRQKFQQFSKGMPLNQKLTLGVTLIIAVMGFVTLFRWAAKPDFAILFSDLDLKEGDQIVESLKSDNIPYKVTGGGSTVWVPSKDVYEWRMKLASQGLPTSGGIGYEIFDKKDIGISDFVQQVNYRRALEGELSRTIVNIQGIIQARVHIVIPQDRLFKEDQNEPTASIVLKLQPNANLNESQIFGITNLVAASVEGLDPDRITVVDSRGRVLSKGLRSDSMAGLSSSQLEIQKNVESTLENKAQSMLAAVLGESKSIVRVSADLNFQKIERMNEKYDPENVAVLSEERTEESNTETGTPGGQGSVEHTITNYQVPKTIENITQSVGDIKRLSVAVLIDGVRKKTVNAETNGEQWVYQPRTEEEMTTLRSIVMSAVGFDPVRNDQLEIQNIPFDTNEEIPEAPVEKPFTKPEFWISIAQKALPVVFLAVFLLIIRSKIRKIKVSLPPTAMSGGNVPLGAGGMSLDSIAVPRIDSNAPPEAVESAKLLKQISQFSQEKPSVAARLLRYWMIEE